MTGYIVRRLLLMVPTVFLVVTLTFFLMHIVPGDAVLAQIEEGTNLRPEQMELMELMRERLGLNQPLYVQYGEWLWGLLHLDAGVSLYTGRPVIDQLVRAIPISIELIIFSQILSISVAIPIGVLSAIRQDTWLDYILRTTSIGMLAAPSFWIATLVIIFGAYWFLWAPPSVKSSATNAGMPISSAVSESLVKRTSPCFKAHLLSSDWVAVAGIKSILACMRRL